MLNECGVTPLSNKKVSFFSTCSEDLISHQCSFLSSKELYQQCFFHKKEGLRIIFILLSRQDNESLPYQLRLLKYWAYNFSYDLTQDELSTLLTLLMAYLGCSKLDNAQKFHVLAIISKLTKNSECSHLQELLNSIEKTLETATQDCIIINALHCLQYLSPLLTEENLVPFLPSLKTKINNSKLDIGEAAIKCLSGIIPKLSEEILNIIAIELEDGISDRASDAKNKCLALIVSKVSKSTLKALALKLNAKMNHSDAYVRYLAVRRLSAIAAELSVGALNEFVGQFDASVLQVLDGVFRTFMPCLPNTSNILIKTLKYRIMNDSGIVFREIAIECLSTMALKLSKDTLNSFMPSIKTTINGFSADLSLAAIRCITVIAPKLSIPILNNLVIELKTSIYREDRVRLASRECLIAIIPLLGENVLNQFLMELNTRVGDSSLFIRLNTINCLCAIAPKLSWAKLSPLLMNIIERIKDSPTAYCAINCIKAMATRIDEGTLGIVAFLLKDRISDNRDIFEAAIDCLYAIAPKLEEHTVNLLVAEFKNTIKGPSANAHQAIELLTALRSRLASDFLNSFTLELNDKANDSNANVSHAAKKCLILSAPLVSTSTRNILVADSLTKINADDPVVRRDAINSLTSHVPYLNAARVNSLALILELTLNDVYGFVRLASLECLILMAPNLSVDILIFLSNKIHNRIYDNQVDVVQAATQCLSIIASQLPQLALYSYAKGSLSMLRYYNYNFSLYANLNISLLSYLKEDNNLLKEVIDILVNSSSKDKHVLNFDFLIQLAGKKELWATYLKLNPQHLPSGHLELDLMHYFINSIKQAHEATIKTESEYLNRAAP